MKPAVLFVVLFGAMGLSSSLQAHKRDVNVDSKLALVTAHAGDPVREARWFTSTHRQSFEALGDQSLLLWVSHSRAYLVKVSDSCFALNSALAIAPVSRLSTQDNIVILDSSGLFNSDSDANNMTKQGCRVREIRPVDVAALKMARKESKGLAELQTAQVSVAHG